MTSFSPAPLVHVCARCEFPHGERECAHSPATCGILPQRCKTFSFERAPKRKFSRWRAFTRKCFAPVRARPRNMLNFFVDVHGAKKFCIVARLREKFRIMRRNVRNPPHRAHWHESKPLTTVTYFQLIIGFL